MSKLNELKKKAISLGKEVQELLTVPEHDMAQADLKDRNTKFAELKSLKDEIQALELEDEVKGYFDPSGKFEFSPTKAGEATAGGEISDSLKGISEKQAKAISSSEYNHAFKSYCMHKGDRTRMDAYDYKILQEGNDTAGGFLVPEEIMAQLIQKKLNVTSVQDNVATFTTGRDSLNFPRLNYTTDNIYTAPQRFTQTGEIPASATTANVTDPNFGQTRIDVFNYMATEFVTNSMVEDSLFDMNALIAEKFSQAIRMQTENTIVNGTGVDEPVGILASPGGTIGNQVQPAVVPLIVGTNTNNLPTAKGIIQLGFSVEPQYEDGLAYYFNKTNTAKNLYSMLDSNGRPIFGYGYDQAGLASGPPRFIQGYPFHYSPVMPNGYDTTGASGVLNNYPIIFGDLRGYYKVERVGFSITVLDQPYATINQIGIVGRWRWGGATVKDWMIKVGKVSTS